MKGGTRMELGKQIKKYRNDFRLSQQALAEKIFVSRQTISNWENDKSYPDVSSLLLLSEVFQVSIDILIKGDIEDMKEQIHTEDMEQFDKLSKIFGTLLIGVIVLPIPLVHFLNYVGIAIWVMLLAIAMYFSIKVEKQKKHYNIQTYKEIIAFTEGKSLDEIAKTKEEGKHPYQKVLLAIVAGVVTLIIALLMVWILGVSF